MTLLGLSLLDFAVHCFALPDDAVFVRDCCIPALFVSPVSQQDIAPLAVGVHVHSQIPSRQDFGQVREVLNEELLPMHCDELIELSTRVVKWACKPDDGSGAEAGCIGVSNLAKPESQS